MRRANGLGDRGSTKEELGGLEGGLRVVPETELERTGSWTAAEDVSSRDEGSGRSGRHLDQSRCQGGLRRISSIRRLDFQLKWRNV